MNYFAHHLVPPHSLGGGDLALLWKQEVEVKILSTYNNLIDTHIKDAGKNFYVTFIYGEPDKAKRKAIWELLTNLGKYRSDPWYRTGDFNGIIDSSEKQGGLVKYE